MKTAVLNHVNNLPDGMLRREDVAALSFAFQYAMAEVLAERCEKALSQFLKIYKPATPTLVISGGVAANQAIRKRLEILGTKTGARIYAPPLNLCSDNAAMIAWAGLERLRAGVTPPAGDPLDFKAKPRWPLDPEASARQGSGIKAKTTS